MDGETVDFSDAAVSFDYLTVERVHVVSLSKGDRLIRFHLEPSSFDACPAVRTLPASGTGLPGAIDANLDGGTLVGYQPFTTGASGTFTMLGYHVSSSPPHVHGLAFSCADCILAPVFVSPDASARSGMRLHGEVHVVNPSPRSSASR